MRTLEAVSKFFRHNLNLEREPEPTQRAVTQRAQGSSQSKVRRNGMWTCYRVWKYL